MWRRSAAIGCRAPECWHLESDEEDEKDYYAMPVKKIEIASIFGHLMNKKNNINKRNVKNLITLIFKPILHYYPLRFTALLKKVAKPEVTSSGEPKHLNRLSMENCTAVDLYMRFEYSSSSSEDSDEAEYNYILQKFYLVGIHCSTPIVRRRLSVNLLRTNDHSNKRLFRQTAQGFSVFLLHVFNHYLSLIKLRLGLLMTNIIRDKPYEENFLGDKGFLQDKVQLRIFNLRSSSAAEELQMSKSHDSINGDAANSKHLFHCPSNGIVLKLSCAASTFKFFVGEELLNFNSIHKAYATVFYHMIQISYVIK
uniref:Uncharacterized protein n=1 Tax=Strigamia maritima TaxID=126957 RepID=T1IV37_STRMM